MAQSPTESTPLLEQSQDEREDSTCAPEISASDVRHGYDFRHSATQMVDDAYTGTKQVVEFDETRTSTIAVLFMWTGTVLSNILLWTEQFIVIAIFVLIAGCGVGFSLWKELGIVKNESQVGQLTSFTSVLSALAAFLLTFYTNLSMDRWWRLRCEGVGKIWASTSQLCLLLSQMVTRDEEVLGKVRRYARASLSMIFLRRLHQEEPLTDTIHYLSAWGVLTKDEIVQLQETGINLPEAIWTWIINIITQLYNKGCIKSEMQYTFLLDKALEGRSGCATICAQINTPIPFMYVHLLGLLVKLHNILLAIAMALQFIFAYARHDWLYCFQVCGRVFFVPLFYNAILIINQDLSDPFSGDKPDFPFAKYVNGIDSDGISYIKAGDNLPQFLKTDLPKKDFKGMV